MLTVTPIAAEAVRELVAAAPIDEADGGIRITVGESTPSGTALKLALVDAPEDSDAAVEASGARVFLEPAVAEFLDDKVLDVDMSAEPPSFAVREQGDFEPGDNGRPI